jgi:glycine/D-amino acid oxidase-like deaminating enzyme
MTTRGAKDAGDNDLKEAGATATPKARASLTFDLDVDVCVVGAGLAGLTVAREAARLGASVAVLEGRQVGWNASGHQLGTVMPGFGIGIADLIARVGYHDARDLWLLAQEGAEYVRATATEIPGMDLTEGALEVSNVDTGDRLISRLQTLGEDFGTEVEGWQADRVREVLKTGRYFHGIHYPRAFQVDGRHYVHGLAVLAEAAGARIFEDTPVLGLDLDGIRKRIATPSARLRASHIVLAGGVHLGEQLQRLSDTLLPVWRYAAVTAPLGEELAHVLSYRGSVNDSDGIAHYRIVDGDRLMWSGIETTREREPQRFARAISRQIRSVYPALRPIEIAEVFGGVVGHTVHGMPQIGELRRGVWVSSGFGRQGLNTSAMAAQLIARGILLGDDRWRLFAPFELVWAGGSAAKVAGQVMVSWSRGRVAVAGAFARYRERARVRAQVQEARRAMAAAKRPRPITDVRTPPGPGSVRG